MAEHEGGAPDGRIRVLDEKTANQIAAGEVVERSASVVKELIENALDAGARRVSASIRGGGAALIQVVDDGFGIAAADLPTALLRHATSKISGEADLHRLSTLGFRGEALPSIASVSRFEIVSRRAEDLAAARITVEAGVQKAVEETAAPPGTRVTVRDLFYNVPARLKFLRSRSAEGAQVGDVVTRLALSRPNVAIRLEADGRRLIQTSGSGRFVEAVQGTLGADLAGGLIPLPGTLDLGSERSRGLEAGPLIHGYIGKPEISRVGRGHQYFFVNGRAIKSTSLKYPLEEAFRGRLTTGRYPVAFIFIEIDPSLVDVNVHPSKLEVRFEREAEIKAAIYRAVRQALDSAGTAGNVPPVFPVSPNRPRPSTWSPLSFGEALEPYIVSDTRSEPPPPEPHSPNPLVASLRPLGQFRRTYILAEGEDGLYLIDQHAAHERVFFDFLRQPAREGRTPSQYLALPIDLDLGPGGSSRLSDYGDELAAAGFEIQPFGGNTVLVKAAPQFLCLGGSHLVRDFFERLLQTGDGIGSLGRLEEIFRAAAACRAAVKARDELDLAEMSSLVAQLAAADDPFHCPHGRPTMISLATEDLERRFRRRA